MAYAHLVDLHARQALRFGPRAALRWKQHGLYHDLSWENYRRYALAGAASLVARGLPPGAHVGLLSENRLEWLLADMAILTAGCVNVPAHAPLSARQIGFQFAHAEVSWIFVSTSSQLQKVLAVRDRLPAVRRIVLFDEPSAQLPDDVETWPSFLRLGYAALAQQAIELRRRATRLQLDDLATIMYTSGTTGEPKGVMLTHGNLLSNALSMLEGIGVDDESIILSWLPYSHIYGRLVDHYVSIAAGATLCLAESQETLLVNLREIQPTQFSAVPRFYEKVLSAVHCEDTQEMYRRLRRVFGTRIRWLNSGGAPLPIHVARIYHDAGLKLLQGYGLTETSPVISFNRPDSNKIGTVGQAVPGVEIRIAEDGEILTRGPHVMKGYWKNPAATAEALRDGWLHTGDLGSLDPDGYLTITGRKKEILVLSNGKKVVPADIEGRLTGDPLIEQAAVFGEGKSYLTALIVPRLDRLRQEAQSLDLPASLPDADLLEHPRIHDLFAHRIAQALQDLSQWEQVRKFRLLPRPFTLEADEMTVSLKLRRQVIYDHFREDIERLYT